MPALVLFGRRTSVGGDDVACACLLTFLLRILQLIVALPLLVWTILSITDLQQEEEENDCDDKHNEHSIGLAFLIVYLGGSIGLALFSMGIEAMIWNTSARGTPTLTSERHFLVPLCQIRWIGISSLRILLVGFGLASAVTLGKFCECARKSDLLLQLEESEDQISNNNNNDNSNAKVFLYEENDYSQCFHYPTMYTFLAILLGSHIVESILSLVVATCLFRPNIVSQSRPHHLILSASSETRWTITCRCCCACTSLLTCCLFGGREAVTKENAFTDISMALTDYFADGSGGGGGGTLDIVASDIVVGLMMLMKEQKQRQEECRQELLEKKKSRQESDVPKKEEEAEVEGGREEERTEEKEEQNEHGAQVNEKDKEVRSVSGETTAAVEVIITTDEENCLQQKEEEVHDGNSEQSPPRRSSLVRRTSTTTYNMRRRGSLDDLYFEATERDLLSPDDPFDVSTIAEGAHFMRVAQAIYTWIMYVMDNKYTGPCTLTGTWLLGCAACSPQFCSCCRDRKENRAGENACRWHETALLNVSGLDETDILYAQFEVGVVKNPYCIAVDHEWKSFVISIRGTLSLDDAATDLMLDPEPLDAYGERCGFDGQGEYCHKGVLGCANWIYNDIERHGILHKVLLGDSASKYPGYKLRIVGHSLGAGCAAALSLLLHSKYPDLCCLCFEPPGCTLSLKAAQRCRDFVTSFVYDTDIVPRLSLQSMENLREDVLEMIARIKVPKRRVLIDYVVAGRKNGSDSNSNRNGSDISELLHGPSSIPPSDFTTQLAEFKKYQQRRKEARGLDNDNNNNLIVPMFVPGRIVHLVKTSQAESSLRKLVVEDSTDRSTARWAMPEDFTEIILSSHMLADHHPETVRRKLELVATSFGLQPPHFKIGEEDVPNIR